jgi:hypothetical protein
VNFFDADSLPGEDCAEIDFLPTETDPAAMGDHDGSVVERVVDVWKSCVGTRGSLVNLGRTFHVQSFTGALVIEDFDKFVAARLLLQEIPSRWFGSFFFQSEMHAFVQAVLRGVARLDAFNANAEPKPPHGQLAQVVKGNLAGECAPGRKAAQINSSHNDTRALPLTLRQPSI